MIYFDSAATTLQKPSAVARASAWAIEHLASPGRGGHLAARRAAETAYTCRKLAAELFEVDDPQRVVLTFNATHGLNLAIKTLVKSGMTVLISGYEHNAVTRPLLAIPGVNVKVAAGPLFCPEKFMEEFRLQLTQEVDVVVCTHVSNVFGYRLPVEGIAAACRKRGVPFVLDASQSAGMLPISLRDLGAAFIAMPGHKGLYGPQGTGLLLCGDGEAAPLLEGGTGTQSLLQHMPEALPDRLEAGTHNMPGIAGLLEGLRFVRETGIRRIADHERHLAMHAAELLEEINGVELFRNRDFAHQTGVLSFRVDGWDCEELGERLAAQGAAVRAGLHCAPLAHRTAGTLETGTIRLSMSAFNTPCEAARFAAILRRAVR